MDDKAMSRRLEQARQAGVLNVDDEYQADQVTDSMAAVGGLVLLEFTSELGPNQAMGAAKKIFCAMRAVDAQQKERGHGRA